VIDIFNYSWLTSTSFSLKGFTRMREIGSTRGTSALEMFA
jgi:hypothetical protein